MTENDLTMDLSFAPSTLFIFGLAGCGKSFIGELIGKYAGWHVYHADDDLTQDMQSALDNEQPFTESMRENFFALIIKKIVELQKEHKHLVVTQAVYKRKYREYLLNNISNMELLMVDTDDSLITQRIDQRDCGISKASAAALRQDFEYPDSYVKVIFNNGGAQHIIEQLNQYYASE